MLVSGFHTLGSYATPSMGIVFRNRLYTKLEIGSALSRISLQAEALDKEDDKGLYRRGRELNKWGANSRREDRPTMYFPISGPNGEGVYPIRNDGAQGRWRWGKSKMHALVAKGDIEFVKRENGTYIVYEKIRSTDPRSKPYRTWLEGVGTTADGSKEVRDLFDGRKVFDFAKPVKLLKQIVRMGTSGNGDIVMDFFAGSGTTAQAVLELNREDGGERQFICVQLPESTPQDSEARKAGYRSIAEVGEELIRRVIKQMLGDTSQLALLEERDNPEDLGFLGFKVLRLGNSNFKRWRDYQGDDLAQLEDLFDRIETPLLDEWMPADLLTEVLLLQGFPLDSSIMALDAFARNKVLRVSSGVCAHTLYVCLDPEVADGTVDRLALNPEDMFVCLDSALSDEGKQRLADMCNLQTI